MGMKSWQFEELGNEFGCFRNFQASSVRVFLNSNGSNAALLNRFPQSPKGP